MLHLIPKPALLNHTAGTFTLSNSTSIIADPQIVSIANLLAGYITEHTKLNLNIVPVGDSKKSITIKLTADSTFGDEGYSLNITADEIHLQASTPAGLFYASQTFRQLLTATQTPFNLPLVSITDSPRSVWRGAMLDVARHFFSVEEVKRFIDLIAHYKINRLHLGLTNDQGWRIEIKSWTKLTEIGAQTQ